MQFPSVTGSNLQRRKLDLPESFEGALNLVLIQGRVLWRAEGSFTQEKGESLAAAVQGGDQDEAE